MSLWWIIGYLVLERLFELALSSRNRNQLKRRGGQEHYPHSYRALVVLHGFFMASLVAESYPWQVPLDPWTFSALACFAILQAVRYWCIWALGVHWNARIIVVPGSEPVRRGPYKVLRHPNYLVVAVEFLVIPALFRTPLTLVVFFLANLVLIIKRIKLEEQVLLRETEYRKVFGLKQQSNR